MLVMLYTLTVFVGKYEAKITNIMEENSRCLDNILEYDKEIEQVAAIADSLLESHCLTMFAIHAAKTQDPIIRKIREADIEADICFDFYLSTTSAP